MMQARTASREFAAVELDQSNVPARWRHTRFCICAQCAEMLDRQIAAANTALCISTEEN